MKLFFLALLALGSFSLKADNDLSKPLLVITAVKGDHANFRNQGNFLYLNTPMVPEKTRGSDLDIRCDMMKYQIKKSMQEIEESVGTLDFKVHKKVSETTIGFDKNVFRCEIFVFIENDSFVFETGKTENFYLADKGGDPLEDAGLVDRAHDILAKDSSVLNFFNVDRVSFTRKYHVSFIKVISKKPF